jgi:DNA polymerase elongation subunit (family B)
MKIAVFDFETDPFKHGRKPEPFACGWYDGSIYLHWWESDPATLIEKIVTHIRSINEPMIVYAHNGGKFDFMYIMREFETLKIVNGRVLCGTIGSCELRDSWGIIPESLAKATKGKKKEIDISKLERDVRDKHRDEILDYMKTDCVELWKLVDAFAAEFGNKLTIGGTAMKELRKHHDIQTGDADFDKQFRDYYYGGRCQVFEPGIHHGRFNVVDINSAYGYVMAELLHPVSTYHVVSQTITSRTDFALIEAENDGALPVRTKTGLSFTCEYGQFFTTRHEIEAGVETGRLRIKRVIRAIEFPEKTTFGEFINHFNSKKVQAELDGNQILRDFYKRVNNSSYWKFAQNPEDHCEYTLTRIDEALPQPQYIVGMTKANAVDCWRLSCTNGDYFIWERPSPRKTYYNVATAASITGATRAHLLRGIAQATRPLYCDTDSLICEAFDGELHDTKLGAWKLEKYAVTPGGAKTHSDITEVCIAGKKLYACFINGVGVKKASKGANVPFDEIRKIANGATYVHKNIAPVFKLDGRVEFVERRMKRTG